MAVLPCHLWTHMHVNINVFGVINLVPIDPFFPFRPRSVIISHRVISHPFDTFHSFLALRIPFVRPTWQHVLSHGLIRPANHAGGKPWDPRCRQQVVYSPILSTESS